MRKTGKKVWNVFFEDLFVLTANGTWKLCRVSLKFNFFLATSRFHCHRSLHAILRQSTTNSNPEDTWYEVYDTSTYKYTVRTTVYKNQFYYCCWARFFCGNYTYIPGHSYDYYHTTATCRICLNVWCTTQLAKLSFNHSHGRIHSWRFSTFNKNYRYLEYLPR